ncbi:hypothetical protein [Coralloluteibacterium thermophilus]|uniref:Lipoprotein n=1 Tax=Coralloluteibacterium thermophilum TaxID=2707049 RepID=A0ABV9NIJ0_9GAMM
MTGRRVALAVLVLGLAGCGDEGRQPAGHLVPPPQGRVAVEADPGVRRFRAIEFGFELAYPPEVTFTRSFQRSHLGAGGWKAFAPTNSRGEPVAALVLPGSNALAAGELRVGVSTQAADVAACLELPPSAVPGTRGEEEIDGVPFVRFDAHGTARNSRMFVRGFRAVRNRQCYAIDLIVTGTDADPATLPQEPPFSREEALVRVSALLDGFGFIRR